ncbi:MAG: PspC domain-containing protein [Chitinivibrionales bacterium]|nr:PspC domain-containing protein [Chitinivibrionales bacterium]
MKRIYRLEEGKKVAGICSGLGDLYSMDANIIRVAVVFLCVATGIAPTVIAYLAAWYLLPLETTSPKKAEEKK